MFNAFDRNPLLGNLLLALIFGGILFAITFKFFEGHPQMMLYLGLSAFGMIVFFFAGAAHDRDQQRPEPRGQKIPQTQAGSNDKRVIAHQQQELQKAREEIARLRGNQNE